MSKRKIDEIYDEYDTFIVKIFTNIITLFKIEDNLIKSMCIQTIQCVIKLLNDFKAKYYVIIKKIIDDCITFLNNDYLKIYYMLCDEGEILNETIYQLQHSYNTIISILKIKKKKLCIMHGCCDYAFFNYPKFNESAYCSTHKTLNMIRVDDQNLDDNLKFYLFTMTPLIKKIFNQKITFGVLSDQFLNNLFENDIKKNASICRIINAALHKQYFINMMFNIQKNHDIEYKYTDSVKILSEIQKDLKKYKMNTMPKNINNTNIEFEMKKIKSVNKCITGECLNVAHYGFKFSYDALFCYNHKMTGTIKKHLFCIHSDCDEVACFKYPDDTETTHCQNHKT